MGTFDPSWPRWIILTMIRWTRGHGNKDWDIRMKEYTSFKVVITAFFYIFPLATAQQMRLMIARMCRCVSQRRATRPGSSDSGAVDQALRSATNRDRRVSRVMILMTETFIWGTGTAAECEELKPFKLAALDLTIFCETFRTLRRVHDNKQSSLIWLLLNRSNYKVASKLLL